MTDDSLSPADCARQFAAALNEQCMLCRRVLQLSVKQQESIAAGDSEALITLLGDKQILIVQNEEAGRHTEELRALWATVREQVTDEEREPVEKAWNELCEVLNQIVLLEDEGRQSLEDARNSKGEEISKLQKGKALHKVYGGGKRPPPPPQIRDESL